MSEQLVNASKASHIAEAYAPRLVPKKKQIHVKKEQYTLLSQRKTIEALHKKKMAHEHPTSSKVEKIQKRRGESSVWIHPAEILAKSLHREAELQRQNVRLIKSNKIKQLSIEEQKVVLLVIRTTQDYQCTKLALAIFKRLRLDKPFTAILMRQSPKNFRTMVTLKPFVEVVSPPASKLSFLIHTSACVEVNKKRVHLSSNTLVEEHFGQCGLLCIDDLVREIIETGPWFDSVVRFLAPFEVGRPKRAHARQTALADRVDRGIIPHQDEFGLQFGEWIVGKPKRNAKKKKYTVKQVEHFNKLRAVRMIRKRERKESRKNHEPIESYGGRKDSKKKGEEKTRKRDYGKNRSD